MQPKIKNITIGSDPEYAILLNGIPVSGVGFLPGTKKQPYDMNGYVSCQTDNVGAECCIPPVTNADDFVKYMQMARVETEKMLQKTMPGAILASLSSEKYSDKELDSDQARLFGCEPSFCCYTGGVSPRPTPEEVGSLRSFGFHIHIGFTPMIEKGFITVYESLIKAMDIMLGVPSIVIDTDVQRRNIYGNAGDFRFKQINPELHIVEYRTLGAAMHASEERLRFCYEQTMKAVDMVNTMTVEEIDELGAKAQEIIDNGFVEEAIDFCNKMNINITDTIHENQYANVCIC